MRLSSFGETIFLNVFSFSFWASFARFYICNFVFLFSYMKMKNKVGGSTVQFFFERSLPNIWKYFFNIVGGVVIRKKKVGRLLKLSLVLLEHSFFFYPEGRFRKNNLIPRHHILYYPQVSTYMYREITLEAVFRSEIFGENIPVALSLLFCKIYPTMN
jgi:hypothetical protein